MAVNGNIHQKKTAVLLMAYGSPESVKDMEAYLLDIRGGRPTSKELVEEISERYTRIGGRSPLLEITRQQAAALEAELNRRVNGEHPIEVYVGMPVSYTHLTLPTKRIV